MGAGGKRSSYVPSWVVRLGAPVWIRDPQGNISYLNEHAEALLGKSANDVVGLPCHRVVASWSASGERFCREHCTVSRLAGTHAEIQPVEVRVGGDGDGGHWIRFLTIPVEAPDHSGPWLVHCALEADRGHRIENYLSRVCRDGTGDHCRIRRRADLPLTDREREILQHLAEGEDLHVIAGKLFISHATVRNHVQHILAKMGVHSITQAVACYLLARE